MGAGEVCDRRHENRWTKEGQHKMEICCYRSGVIAPVWIHFWGCYRARLDTFLELGTDLDTFPELGTDLDTFAVEPTIVCFIM